VEFFLIVISVSSKKGENYFAGKKVLVFGLGLLGGGAATTNWLLKQGAKVTVTDLKDEKQLASSLKKIKGKVKLALGGHREEDIKENEIIVLNPDVSPKNHFIRLARKMGKQIENEATIFYKLCNKPIVAVTGTRGKTTTANWLAHFLNARHKTVASGNSYIEPLLKTLDRVNKFSVVVNELPSYHLELFDGNIKAPEAIITNIFQDHLNRHGSLESYARVKANIFRNQTGEQNLVLNCDNKWTPFFLRLKPKAKTWFFSLSPLPRKLAGVFYKDGIIFFQSGDKTEKVLTVGGFIKKWGEHNLYNLLAASLMAFLCGIPWPKIRQRIKTLPQIPFRQEVVFENRKIKIINDTAATSPDGGIAAIKRFASPSVALAKEGRPHCILIAGGTDRQLDYSAWARVVSRMIKKENLILLTGSATEKMIGSLNLPLEKTMIFDTLKECIQAGLAKARKLGNAILLFSPAAKSFEKFKNEFDRGKQFNALVRKEVGKWTKC
jgi:UDP-N-acetylmuramoylalanine--D-glutamate ligase